jgi:hypothetical protein
MTAGVVVLSRAFARLSAFVIVLKGAASVPAFVSRPVGLTKMVRTCCVHSTRVGKINIVSLLAPDAVLSTCNYTFSMRLKECNGKSVDEGPNFNLDVFHLREYGCIAFTSALFRRFLPGNR